MWSKEAPSKEEAQCSVDLVGYGLSWVLTSEVLTFERRLMTGWEIFWRIGARICTA